MELTAALEQAYAERVDLLILALTGRTGSGCTTVSNLLCGQFLQAGVSGVSTPTEDIEDTKQRICHTLLARQWVPFHAITVSTVIYSYLVELTPQRARSFLANWAVGDKLDRLIDCLASAQGSTEFSDYRSLTANNDPAARVNAWSFYQTTLSPSAMLFKEELGTEYADVFQTIGNNARLSGEADVSSIDTGKPFDLIRRVKRLAKAAMYADRASGTPTTRVVIDAIRNPLELVYLRDQFSAFFCLAVTTEDADRRERLHGAGMSDAQITTLDEREYRKDALGSYESFVSQNIEECIQKSDIFVANPGKRNQQPLSLQRLTRQVNRYVALMIRPGLVTPTRDERCMQIAFVAKANSGCISRQVGAVVTDKAFSVKAVGWNDVAKGQVSCLHRSVEELGDLSHPKALIRPAFCRHPASALEAVSRPLLRLVQYIKWHGNQFHHRDRLGRAATGRAVQPE